MSETLCTLKKNSGTSGGSFTYTIINSAVGSKYGTFPRGDEINTLTFTADSDCSLTANTTKGYGNYYGVRIYINNVLIDTTTATSYPSDIVASASKNDVVQFKFYCHSQPGNMGLQMVITISY